MRYVTDCPAGKCYLDQSQTERIRAKSKTGHETRHHVCKEHKGRVIARQTVCEVCGEIFETYKSGPLSTKCKPCQEKIKKAREKQRNRERHLPKTEVKNNVKMNLHLADSERGDCKHRSDCGWKYLDCQAIPCLCCERYEKSDLSQARYRETTRQYGSQTLNTAYI